MYCVQACEPDEDNMRVFKFSSLFLPDSEKLCKQMEMYNRKHTLDFPDFEDEMSRKRKRELKERIKKTK